MKTIQEAANNYAGCSGICKKCNNTFPCYKNIERLSFVNGAKYMHKEKETISKLKNMELVGISEDQNKIIITDVDNNNEIELMFKPYKIESIKTCKKCWFRKEGLDCYIIPCSVNSEDLRNSRVDKLTGIFIEKTKK